MIHASRPIFSTQFHPEAKGGPLDSAYLFDTYLESVRRYRDTQVIHNADRGHRPSPLLVDILPKDRVGVTPTRGMLSIAAQAKQQASHQELTKRRAAAAA